MTQIIEKKPATTVAPKATSGVVIIDSIIPRANSEKPNILISGYNAEDETQRISNAFYMHTDGCKKVSREQIASLFGIDAIQLASTADDVANAKHRFRFVGKPDGIHMNYNFYPEKTAIEVTLATKVFGE